MYHRIGEAHNAWEHKYCVSPQRFASHMHLLASRGMQAVSIDDFISWVEGTNDLPVGSFLLTFDDGFRGVREYGLPVLGELGWPFSIFLVSDLIGGQDVWTREANPDSVTYPLLDKDEILDMQQRGVSFHSHTCNHPSLTTLDETQLADQLVASRQTLSQLLGQDVSYLAYPFGHVDERVETAAWAAGYRAAFSTQPGFNRRDVNRYRIRRLDVFGYDTSSMLARKITHGSNDGGLGHAAHYYLGRLISRITRIGR